MEISSSTTAFTAAAVANPMATRLPVTGFRKHTAIGDSTCDVFKSSEASMDTHSAERYKRKVAHAFPHTCRPSA